MKHLLRIIGILAVVMAAFIMMPLARGTAYALELDEGVLYVGGQDIVAAGGSVTGDGDQGTAYLASDEDGNPVLNLVNYKCENCTGGSGQTYRSVIQYDGYAKLTIQISGDNAVKPADGQYVGIGIASVGPLVMKGDGRLTATGRTYGIVCDSELQIKSGSITAVCSKNDGLPDLSWGISSEDKILISGGTVNASSGNAGRESYGFRARRGIEITGGTVTATSGNAINSMGIWGVTTIGSGITRVEIAGGTMAIRGNITNAVSGTGWDEIGSGDGTTIDIDTAGRALNYKKVLFEQYAVKINGGKAYNADGEEIEAAVPGETVTIIADDPEEGKIFNQWAHVEGVNYEYADAWNTTFTMPAKDVTIDAVIRDIIITDTIWDEVYTGETFEPDFDFFSVQVEGSGVLWPGSDYELSYEGNVNAGEAKVILTVTGHRKGYKIVTFNILPADISEANVEADDKVYAGENLKPSATVTWKGRKLVEGEDYTLSVNSTNAGEATLTVTGKGNFEGTATDSFEISKAPLTITAKDQTYVYNGQPHGEADPVYEDPAEIAKKVTVEGLQGGDALTTLTLTGTKKETGVYPGAIKIIGFTIGKDGGATGNYKVTTVPGTLTIKKAGPTPTKVSGTLLSKITAKGKSSLVLTWNKVNGSEGYDIFFIKCGKQAPKKVKTIKGNKTFKWTKKSLKKKTAYKAVVKAYVMKNGKKSYIRRSPMVHAYTSGGTKNYTNSKSVTVKKTSVSLKAGKTYKIKAKVNKLKKNKKPMSTAHAAKLRYVSSNKTIATVSKSGKITAKSKGNCKVYVIAVNGASKAITVTVK